MMNDEIPADALLNALFASGNFGLCLLDSEGAVVAVKGSASAWAPDMGSNIDDAPVFVGLLDDILATRDSQFPLTISGIAVGGHIAGAIDIDICWLEDIARFAAVSKSAATRIQDQGAAAQFVRDTRLLEDKIHEQQARIAEQAEMMALFVRHVPAAVAMLDNSLRVVMASARWREEHGDHALIPFGVETASPLTWPRVAADLRLAMDSGVPTTRVEKSPQKGRTTWKRLAQAPWRRADREIGGTILFCEDVTDAMRKAENLRARVEDLHKLGAEMDSLGHAMANDLRAPLRQIDFFSRFLLDADPANPDWANRDYLKQIRICVERIDAMMGALQHYMRLSERDLIVSRFDISEAAMMAAAELRDELKAAGVNFRLHETFIIEGDLALMTGLFRRLFDNAVKYAGEGSAILIDCFEEEGGILVRFTDDGPGIPAHLRRRAFDFFERLDAPASIPGQGMGLAECRKIVDLHNGGMTLDADFDAGLRVLISLPGPAMKSAGARPAPALI